MMARFFTAVPLAVLLAATFVPSPGSANDSNTVVIGNGAGAAAFGLTAALFGRSGRLHVYPAPPVLYMPAPVDATVPPATGAPPLPGPR
ncbi:MAG TPA: hypothetical protein VMB81_09480 [Candidatus Sulfotelmatobacter sp.]|nr:hypothetical protein [Candidatus Sulfotelmatobacter sp.]